MSRRSLPLAVLAVLAYTTAASAQTWLRADAPRRGSIEIGGGALWGPSIDYGERQAQQTRNPTTGSGPFDLFATDTTLQAATGAQAHVAFYFTRAIAVEAGARYQQPRLRVRITGDAEDAESITAEETITQYVFDGSLVFHLTNLTFAEGMAVPFVLAGAGHVRDLHQGEELVETGTEFHGGGGLKWWFGSGRRRFGLRVEGRATSREGGFDFGDERRTILSGGVGLSYVF